MREARSAHASGVSDSAARARAMKVLGLAVVALGSLFFLLMGVGEIAGGEVSGVQHLPQAALLAALVLFGRRHPYGVGVVLFLIGLGFASLYAAGFFGVDEPVGTRIGWALQIALPPLVAAVLLIGSAQREREGPDGRAQSARAPEIGVREAAPRIERGDLFAVDVRETDEWLAGHIRQAVHVPQAEVRRHLGEIPADRDVVVVCRSGNRSGKVATELRTAGYAALNLRGGMRAWHRIGLPIEPPSGRVA